MAGFLHVHSDSNLWGVSEVLVRCLANISLPSNPLYKGIWTVSVEMLRCFREFIYPFLFPISVIPHSNIYLPLIGDTAITLKRYSLAPWEILGCPMFLVLHVFLFEGSDIVADLRLKDHVLTPVTVQWGGLCVEEFVVFLQGCLQVNDVVVPFGAGFL